MISTTELTLLDWKAVFGLIITIALVCVFLPNVFSLDKSVDAPMLDMLDKRSKIYDYKSAISQSYNKFKDGIYQLRVPYGKLVILPKRFVNEIRNMPDEAMDFHGDMKYRHLQKYTGILGSKLHNDVVAAAVKNDLPRHLAQLVPELQEELDIAFSEEIPECKDWTSLNSYKVFVQAIAYMSGRVFVGSPLNHDKDFLRTTITHSTQCVQAGQEMWKYPAILRPIAQYFVPGIRNVPHHKQNMERLLGPIIKERLRLEQTPGYEKPRDMTQWILDRCPPEKRTDILFQATCQLNVSLAAIHTTNMALAHMIFDLCSYPEYIQPLREEVERVLKEDGGTFQQQSLVKLRLLDSFMKESQRHSPFNYVSMNRRVHQDTKLSSGFILPKGVHVCFPGYDIGHDPELLPNPNSFDGFRYAKMREDPGNESNFQFATTSENSLPFGYGKHACPGRFMAGNEIKLLLSNFIRRYDFKFPDDNPKRPENIYVHLFIMADISRPILVRKRQDVA